MDENKLEAKLKAKQAQMEKNKEEIVGLKKKLSDVRKKKLLRERQEQEAKLLRIVRKLRPALERVYGSSFFQKPETWERALCQIPGQILFRIQIMR